MLPAVSVEDPSQYSANTEDSTESGNACAHELLESVSSLSLTPHTHTPEPASQYAAELRCFSEPPPDRNFILYIFHDYDTVESSRGRDLFQKLADSIDVRIALSASDSLKYIHKRPRAVILADRNGIALERNEMVAKALSVYVLCDGRLIVGLAASERVFSGWFDEFFREGFNVHWSRGDHCMTEYKLKDDVVLPSGVDPALVRPRFTMHAVLVKNAQPHEKIYVPVPGARDWRFPGDEDKPVDESQAAAVWAPMGRGFVAYCGDLHVDEYAVDLILALCGFKQREVHPSGQEDAVMGESP